MDISTNEPYHCINLLKSNNSTDTTMTNLSATNLTTPGSISSSLTNSRLCNSVKGNHIERIASLLSVGFGFVLIFFFFFKRNEKYFRESFHIMSFLIKNTLTFDLKQKIQLSSLNKHFYRCKSTSQ